jgi:hypothetical protein
MHGRADFARVAEWAAILREAEMRRICRDPAYRPYLDEDLLTLAWIGAAAGADPIQMASKLAAEEPAPALVSRH